MSATQILAHRPAAFLPATTFCKPVPAPLRAILRSQRRLKGSSLSPRAAASVDTPRPAGPGTADIPKPHADEANGAGQSLHTQSGKGFDVQTAKLPSGYDIPLLGFGTFGIPADQTAEAVRSALTQGYRHFDTAVVYQNEKQVGEAVNEWLKAGHGKREDLFIVTKIWSDQKSVDAAEAAIRTSLDALQLDYVDLVLVHWPITDAQSQGALIPSPQDTWEGLSRAVEKGLVRSIGVSNHSPEKIQAWLRGVRIPVSVNQVESHPQWRNDKVLDYCKQNNIHQTSYAPLSSPGQMQQMGRQVPNALQDTKVVKDIAQKLNKTPAQVLLAWGIQRGTSVIPKAIDAAHQKDNAGAVGLRLPEEDFTALSSIEPQIRYFLGEGFGYSSEGTWHTYEDLWNEPKPVEP